MNYSRLKLTDYILSIKLVKEITSLGSVTLARQAMVSIVVLLVNNILLIRINKENRIAERDKNTQNT